MQADRHEGSGRPDARRPAERPDLRAPRL